MKTFGKQQVCPRQAHIGLKVVGRRVVVSVSTVLFWAIGKIQSVAVEAVYLPPAGTEIGSQFHTPSGKWKSEIKLCVYPSANVY